MTYKAKFCTVFADKYIDILVLYFSSVIKAIVLLDEFHYYVTLKRLIEDDITRK